MWPQTGRVADRVEATLAPTSHRVLKAALSASVVASAMAGLAVWGVGDPRWPWVALVVALLGLLSTHWSYRNAYSLERSIDRSRHRLSSPVEWAPSGVMEGRGDVAAPTENLRRAGSTRPNDLSVALELQTAAMVEYRARLRARHQSASTKADEADAYQADFLIAASHELRTPLNSILGFTDVLLEELDGPLRDTQREDLQVLHAAGKRLLGLVNDVLDLSAAASGRLQLHPSAVSVAPMISQVVSALQNEARTTGVVFRESMELNLPLVWMDFDRLRQVVQTLLDTAIDLTGKGEIDIGVRRLESTVEISVRDSGIALSEAELSFVFSEFQAPESGQTKRRLRGLGLALCRTLVEGSGGSLSAQRDEAGGTSFRASLPLAERT